MPEPPPPRRSRALRWLVPVGTAFALLAVAEGALRAFGVAGGDDDPRAERRLELTDARLYEPDPELFWRLLPSRQFRLDDSAYPPFRSNLLGLRGAEIPPRKAPGEIRVVCAGDSVTFGLGLADGQTYPDRLQARLRDDVRLLGRQVHVLNAGTPGYGSVQGLRLVRRLVPIRPDVVVWWFGMNDSKPSAVRDADLELPGPVARAVSQTVGGLRIVRAVRGLGAARETEGTRVPPLDFEASLAELRALASKEGFSVVHVRCPNRLDETLRELGDVVAAAEQRGADEVRAPFPILSPWTPSPRPAPLRVSEETGAEGRRRVVVESGSLAADRVVPLADVRRDRDAVARWKTALDALMDRLPAGSVDGRALFRGVPPHEVMTDNCHLSVQGAVLAGDALADAVLAKLEAAGRIGGR